MVQAVCGSRVKIRGVKMDSNFKIPDSVDNAINNLSDKPTKTIGQMLSDALYYKYGGIIYRANERRLIEASILKELEYRLKDGLSRIPINQLIAPDYQTLLLALDSLEPCINSKELRDLFANLITRACNSEYKAFIHPSFSIILKQMSPYDAKILQFYYDTAPSRLVTYTYISEQKERFDRLPYILDTYPDLDEAEQVSISLSSLMHCGILSFHADSIAYSLDDSPFTNSDFYKQCEMNRINEGKYHLSKLTAQACTITPLGRAFIHACFD